jgi:hypothetical protein
MEYLLYGSENGTHNTTDCTLTNTFGLTEFGSCYEEVMTFLPETPCFRLVSGLATNPIFHGV